MFVLICTDEPSLGRSCSTEDIPPLLTLTPALNQQNQDETEMRAGMSEGRFRASAWKERGITQQFLHTDLLLGAVSTHSGTPSPFSPPVFGPEEEELS